MALLNTFAAQRETFEVYRAQEKAELQSARVDFEDSGKIWHDLESDAGEPVATTHYAFECMMLEMLVMLVVLACWSCW